MRKSFISVGMKVGRLTALREFYRGKYLFFECQCDCGRITFVQSGHLAGARLGKGHGTISCGCYRKEKTTKHGMRSTDTWKAWANMRRRCKPFYRFHKDYFDRGITVCEKWEKSFLEFFKDMGTVPPGLSLDRINNDAGYYPGNCRWANRRTQNNNKRNNTFITFNGRTLPLSYWADTIGTAPKNLWARIKRGWSIEEALTIPPRPPRYPNQRTANV